MSTWTLPIGWILLLLTGETATCQDASGSIIVIDVMGV